MVTTETVRDGSAAIGGAPGATANTPEEFGPPDEKNFITDSKETIENFQPSETVRKKKIPAGILKKYNVAALIAPEFEEVPGADGQPQRQAKPMTPAEIEGFRAFILNAVGGGDTVDTEVSVAALPFSGDAAVPVAPETVASAPWTEAPWFNWTWRIGLVGFMFILVRFLMRRALVIPPAEEEEVLEIPEASPAERRAQEIASEVERLSQQEPDTVAALLRTWMSQE
jgi:flagellar biosynthesis/type III secretory pathway M-ring protein FliF/YscJ